MSPNTPAAWWFGRSERERRLLALMLVLCAAVGLWLLAVRPALAWREAAVQRRAAAVAVQARLDEALAARKDAPRDGARPAAEIDALARSLADASGLTVLLVSEEDGAVGFQAGGAPAAAFFGWLADLEAQGVRVRELAVSENADATLEAQGTLLGVAGRRP